jgi:hypothetical protein
MNIKTLHPPRPDVSDWTEVASLQQRLATTVEQINAMAADVGMAKHIIEYDSNRTKKALARAMAAPLAGGSSAAAAEAEGRASEAYTKEMAQLGKEHAAACQVVSEFEALRLVWDTARSLLAMSREQIKTL